MKIVFKRCGDGESCGNISTFNRLSPLSTRAGFQAYCYSWRVGKTRCHWINLDCYI